MKKAALFFAFLLLAQQGFCWGFYAHKKINRLAVFSLPSPMVKFYKHHIAFITEQAIGPDARRYAVEGEAEKHFIDLDIYSKYFQDSLFYKIPRTREKAVQKFTEDTLRTYGIAPWHILKMKYALTQAFKQKNAQKILRLSTDLGHYLADINVPLHTTYNYNGQFTNQVGIHGFWESRLPELFSEDYQLFIGKAIYLDHPQQVIWQTVAQAHLALDSVLGFEKELSKKFPADKKYSYEQRLGRTVKVYSQAYARAYHNLLAGQVEYRFKASIKLVADFWYTCWVDAGKPNLEDLLQGMPLEEQIPSPLPSLQKIRPHESTSDGE